MSHALRLRVNRVEYWRPDHNDTGPILTQVEVRPEAGLHGDPALRIEYTADGQYAPARLVLNFPGKVADLEPGDYLTVTLEKAPPLLVGEAEHEEIPF